MCWARGIGWSTRRASIRQAVGLFANSLGGANAELRVQRGAAHRRAVPAVDLRQPAADHRRRVGAQRLSDLPGPGALAMGSLVTGDNLFARSPVDADPQGRRPARVHRAHPRPTRGSTSTRASSWPQRPRRPGEGDHLVPGERRARADAGGLSAGVRAAAGGVLPRDAGQVIYHCDRSVLHDVVSAVFRMSHIAIGQENRTGHGHGHGHGPPGSIQGWISATMTRSDPAIAKRKCLQVLKNLECSCRLKVIGVV